jgi:hypothetical protein
MYGISHFTIHYGEEGIVKNIKLVGCTSQVHLALIKEQHILHPTHLKKFSIPKDFYELLLSRLFTQCPDANS